MDRPAARPLSRWLQAHSYRLRLLVALLLTLLLVLGLVMRIGLDLVDRSVEDRIGRQVRQLGPLFSAALAIPLAQRDYASIGQVLRDITADAEIDYAVLRDAGGRIVAAQGWPEDRLPPPAMAAFDLSRDARYDLVAPIRLGSRDLGQLHYGFSLAEARARRQALVGRVLTAGSLGLALAVFLSVFFAFGMTRRLARLVQASGRLAAGRLDTRVGDTGRDEIGEVGRALDDMARSLQDSVRELRESEARLERVIHGTSDGFWDWDLETNTTHFSARFRELLGHDDEAEFRAGFFFRNALHDEDREQAVAALVRAVEDGAPFDATYRLRCRDGGYRWFHGRGQATRDAAGRIVRFSGTLTDIHDQKLAEEEVRKLVGALQEEKDLTDALLASLPGLFTLIDERLHILRWNRNLELLTGYTANEIAGMTTDRLYLEADVVAAAVRTAFERGIPVHGEATLKTVGGRRIPCYLHGMPALLGGRKMLVGLGFDITERKQAEAALRDSEARFRKFFEESADASLIIEGDRFVDCNRAALAMLRMKSKHELGTVHPSELSPDTQPDGRSSVEKANEMIQIAFARGSHRFEWLHRRADGEVFPAEVLLTRIEHQGRPLLYTVWRDITDRKRAEAEVLKLNEELEQRVRERTAELTAANRELEAFSYSVSHDLVAPLRAIDGYARMLEEDFAAQIGTSGNGYLARIRAGSQRMHQIIDGMLALSRVTRNEMRREAINLSAIAEQILCDLKQMQPERVVRTHITLDIGVRGDPNLLRMALENLLRNAWKFTARRPGATIEFGVLRGEDKPVYFVSDDGAGFDMQYAGKLFGAFQRMHGAQEFEGTGIGLAIVHRIIQRHGGRIWAEAAPDKGARFYFTLS